MRHALRAGGHVAFSLEATAAAEPGDYVLRASGRYAHSAAYVRGVLGEAGLRVAAIDAAVLREEAMKPVADGS